jgi:TetR/AcrR family transcriptional regulator
MVALQTFQNLNTERQLEIIHVCLEEFALRDYESASLSDIIKKLTLAKGSFYRYFESKQSLYLFLLNHCLETRLKHDNVIVHDVHYDFFELYTKHFEARLQFEKKFPLHSAFLHNLLRQKRCKELEDIQLIAKKKIVELLKPKILEDIKNSKIRKDIDPELLAFVMAQTQFLIIDYISYKHKTDYCDNLIAKKTKSIPEKEIIATGKNIIDIMQKGFKSK